TPALLGRISWLSATGTTTQKQLRAKDRSPTNGSKAFISPRRCSRRSRKRRRGSTDRCHGSFSGLGRLRAWRSSGFRAWTTSSRTKSKSNAPDDSVNASSDRPTPVMPVRESFAQGADGTRLYVREHGGPSELTTILCDGICCDGYIWKYLWDDLGPLTRVVH